MLRLVVKWCVRSLGDIQGKGPRGCCVVRSGAQERDLGWGQTWGGGL